MRRHGRHAIDHHSPAQWLAFAEHGAGAGVDNVREQTKHFSALDTAARRRAAFL